jgi:hypothetical protein
MSHPPYHHQTFLVFSSARKTPGSPLARSVPRRNFLLDRLSPSGAGLGPLTFFSSQLVLHRYYLPSPVVLLHLRPELYTRPDAT